MVIESEIATAVAIIQRTNYSIGGQMVGVRVVKRDANDNEMTNEPGVGLFYTYSDHPTPARRTSLGNVNALSDENGNYVAGSLGLQRPFGSYRVEPTTNPSITDRGFTGHRSNNTGTNDLGLIYMNARFFLPELGRFATADTIVPDPMNPQQFNRYTYSLNSPINFLDPSGHCTENYQDDEASLTQCIAGWNSVVNYLTEQAYGSDGTGQFPNEAVNEWLLNADIATLEGLMQGYGIGYGYTTGMPSPYRREISDSGYQYYRPEYVPCVKDCQTYLLADNGWEWEIGVGWVRMVISDEVNFEIKPLDFMVCDIVCVPGSVEGGGTTKNGGGINAEVAAVLAVGAETEINGYMFGSAMGYKAAYEGQWNGSLNHGAEPHFFANFGAGVFSFEARKYPR